MRGHMQQQEATRPGTPTDGTGPLGDTWLDCFFCDARRPPDLDPFCHRCGGTLIAQTSRPFTVSASQAGMARYLANLPVGRRFVTLGEGHTPLIRLDRLFPGEDVYAKAEFVSVTGSFKDRGSAVAVSAACAMGAEGIVCASTGNNAASVSAYAARAGLPCIVTLPKGTPAAKVLQAKAHGAITVEVAGDFSDAYAMAERINRADRRWANLTSTYLNPYTTAAHATIMYELFEQLGQVGSIFIPIGAGPMLDGIMSGARRLKAANLIADLPVPVGVQAAGCAPIAEAFAKGAQTVEAWSGPVAGIAGSINDPLRGYPQDGTRTLTIIRDSRGMALQVADDDIRGAMRDLGSLEGIAAEPASATPLAALRALSVRNLPKPIVLVVSGHALKDAGSQPGAGDAAIAVDAQTDPLIVVAAARERFAASRGTASPSNRQGEPDAQQAAAC